MPASKAAFAPSTTGTYASSSRLNEGITYNIALAENFADARNARIVGQFECGAVLFADGSKSLLLRFGIDAHRSEFADLERPAAEPGTTLGENDRAAGGQL